MSSTPGLRLLGPPQVSTPNGELTLPPKQTALLAFLAHIAPKAASREVVASLLWPTGSTKNSRHSLSQAIYKIRGCLGKASLTSSQTNIGLGEVGCDWNDFNEYIQQGAYERAARLIRGDFCEEMVIWGCPELNQWLDGVRATFHRTVARILEEPLESDLRNRIQASLDLPVTSAAPRHLNTREPTASSCFVGRVCERRELEDAWRKSIKNQIVTAAVLGEPGIGKTTLCRRVVKKTILQGSRGLTAAGYEVQRNLPYGVCNQIIDGIRRTVADDDILLPAWVEAVLFTKDTGRSWKEAAPVSTELDHRVAGVFELGLRQLSQQGPLTIFVDDVQWADNASLSVLHYLIHCQRDLPIFIILASRSDAVDVFREDRWTHDVLIPLHGLSLNEARLLLRELRPNLEDEAIVRDIHGAAGGNPLLLHAYAEEVKEEDIANVDSSFPVSVTHYFRRETARLSAEAQLIGAALSAAGAPLPSSRLAWLTEMSDESTNEGIGELMAHGFVDFDRKTGTLALKHDSAGEAFLNHLTPVALAKLHGRAAYMLRDVGSPAAIVATQLAVAGSPAETSQYALQAARASLQLYAYREAEHFFNIAIATAAEPGMELDSRISLADILLRQGRSSEAKNILKGRVTSGQLNHDQESLLEAHLWIAKLAEVAPPSVPKQAFRRARLLEPLLPGRIAARLFAAIAGNAQQGLHALVEDCTEAARKPIDRITDRSEQIQFAVRFAAFRAINTNRTPDLKGLDRLLAESKAWPSTFAACLSDIALIRISLGQLREAEEQCVQGLEVCEQYGFLDERLRILNNLGVCYLEQGRWDEAKTQFETVVSSSRSVAPKEVTSAYSNLLILEYERGHLSATIQTGEGYLQGRPLQTRLRTGSLGVLGLAHLGLGRLSKARECYASIQAYSTPDAGWCNDVSYLEILMARLAVVDGNQQSAERRLRQTVQDFWDRDFFCASRMRVEWIRLIASHSPHHALQESEKLRPYLINSNAIPLIERLDRIVARSRARLAH